MNKIMWGAGKKGKLVYYLHNKLDKAPDYIIDNNKDTCLMKNDYIVYGPDILGKLKGENRVYITCVDQSESIRKQIIDLGIYDKDIINHYDINEVLGDLLSKAKKNSKRYFAGDSVAFDMENGDILGGVESWTKQTQRIIENMGFSTELLLGVDGDTEYRIEHAIEDIKRINPRYIVVGFARSNFWAACIYKALYNNDVKIIAVQHNDVSYYYNAYLSLQNYIDCCIVISSVMENKLLQLGFAPNKIKKLGWYISDLKIHRRYKIEKNINVGYAGRLVYGQKRLDRLCEIVKCVNANSQNVIFNIAGCGEYEDTIREYARINSLEKCINFCGVIPQKEIINFWNNQDIMVSCSDYEGHSITQYEAMACGCVPVITDVSGASDDVDNDKNGFIIPITNDDDIINCIATKIVFLAQNPDILLNMSVEASKAIQKKNNYKDVENLWRGILH